MMLGIVKVMTARQQSLGRDASHVETRPAQRSAHFDAGGFETQLSGLDGGYVAAWPAADYHKVVLGGGEGGGEGAEGGGEAGSDRGGG